MRIFLDSSRPHLILSTCSLGTSAKKSFTNLPAFLTTDASLLFQLLIARLIELLAVVHKTMSAAEPGVNSLPLEDAFLSIPCSDFI